MLSETEVANMTDAAMWSLIVGAGLPFIVSLIKQSVWPKWVTTLISVVIFIATGFVTAYLTGVLNGRTIISCILITAVTALTLYRNFYKPTGIDAKITYLTEPKRNHQG